MLLSINNIEIIRENFEDVKGVIRSHISKKDKHDNGQTKKEKDKQ